MKITGFILLSLFFLSSVSPCQNLLNPLPLKIGNAWFYYAYHNVGGGIIRYSFTVVDSGIVINDKSYYKVAYIENGIGYRYLRLDTDEYYKAYDILDYLENGEFWYYKKNAQKGDSWAEKTKDQFPYFYHVVEDTGRGHVFNEEVTVKFIVSSDSGLYGAGEWWTEEFGVIRYNDEGANSYLVGCIIDGIAYGDTTPVNIEQENSYLPKSYLLQNYPNPFNPTTIINYAVPKQSKVTLIIYDALGRELITLVDEEKPPGNYEIPFDGKNLSSGIYFYRLRADQFIQTKKMLLLR